MKKMIAVFLALVLVLALTGCDGKDLEEKINNAVNSAADKIEAGAESLEKAADDLEDKLNGAEKEPEPTEEPEPTDEPEAEPEPAQEEPAPAGDSDIRPEIKDAIDTYEEFFNEYVDFMKSYDASDISALSDYLSFLQEYTEYMQKLDDLENEDLTDAETIYLTQATLRIDQRLLEVVN